MSNFLSKALVWGLGKSGFAAAKLLHQKGGQVWVLDRNFSSELTDRAEFLQQLGIVVNLKTDLSTELLAALNPEVLVVSPGISWHHPVLEWAREIGIKTWGEVELAWQYLANVPWLGITGTNGKTTTTALVAEIFATAGYDAPACGNIGLPICEIALRSAEPDWIIAELSSYQIESSPSVEPTIGIWTTFTPDHLSRHSTLDRYAGIKAHLMHQSQAVVLNQDDNYLSQQAQNFPNALWVSTKNRSGAYIEGDWVYFRAQKIVQLSQWQLLGNHNQQNLLLAVAAASLAGIPPHRIAEAVAKFRSIPHRLEPIGVKGHTLWINDSKATNYDAALTGLEAVADPIILICGGQAKEGDPKGWLDLIQRKVAHVLLIGAAVELFASLFDQINFSNYTIVHTLDRAVECSIERSVNLAAKSVLFSPSCASFDQYDNFEARGEHFRQLCYSKGICHE